MKGSDQLLKEAITDVDSGEGNKPAIYDLKIIDDPDKIDDLPF